MGLKIGFGSTLKGLKMSFRRTPKVEEWLIDLIEAIYWLNHCCKKFCIDLWKYFHGVEDGFESTSKGLKIGFGSLPRG